MSGVRNQVSCFGRRGGEHPTFKMFSLTNNCDLLPADGRRLQHELGGTAFQSKYHEEGTRLT